MMSLAVIDIRCAEPTRFMWTRLVLTRVISGHETVVTNSQLWPLRQIIRGYREVRKELQAFIGLGDATWG